MSPSRGYLSNEASQVSIDPYCHNSCIALVSHKNARAFANWRESRMSDLNPAVIRLAHPLAFSGFLRHIGAPAGRYFRRQNLPSLCKDPSALVPLRKAWGLFDDAAKREDRDVGWHVGQFCGDHELSNGLLKELEKATTLYRALHLFVQMVGTEASHLQLGIVKRSFGILLSTHYPGMRDEPGYQTSQAYQLGVYTDLVRHFTDPGWSPLEIGIEAPDVPAPLRDLYPASPVRVSQPFGYIAILRCDLSRTLCRIHETDEAVGDLTNFAGLSYPDQLSRLLDPYLPQGYPTLQFAAELIETSARTLSRRLSDCGTEGQTDKRYRLVRWIHGPGEF
jgi:hypothetical protein